MKFLHAILLAMLAAMAARAGEIPPYFTYQGRVAVDGTNFHGAGLFKFALVSADGATSYWSHDLTSVGGSEPPSALSIAVERGLFYIHVGDTNIAGMAALPPNLFATAQPRLRVWFSDGVNPFEAFTPDHSVGSVPYALVAGQVRGGSIGTNALDPSIDARYVNVEGDTMTGALSLPADGLSVGATQLILNNGRVGVGTTNPTSPLTIVGGAGAGDFIFEAFAGTNRVGWARKKE